MKLAGFRSTLGGSATEQLQGYVKELKHIYDENVVPFENTDDQYNASLGIRYNEWCILCQVFRENLTCSIGPIASGNWTDVQGLGDYFRDIGYTIENFCCGVGNAVKDFVMGNVLESIGQSMFDTADEKGIAYSSGYVAADVVIAILTDKGLDKLKSTGKAGKTTANVVDDVTDVAEDAARAGKEAGEAARNAETVAEGLEGNAAKAAESAGKGGSNAIPNVESATINPKKLTEYALNPNHPVGGNKARVFESALGYNQSNADDLMRQIYEKLSSSEAVLGKLDEYGQRYTVDIPITGPNGNTVNVRTGWIIRTGSDIPELTTIFVKE